MNWEDIEKVKLFCNYFLLICSYHFVSVVQTIFIVAVATSAVAGNAFVAVVVAEEIFGWQISLSKRADIDEWRLIADDQRT